MITLSKYNWSQYILELQICLVSMSLLGRSSRVWAEGSACCLSISVSCTELAQSLGLEMLAEWNEPQSSLSLPELLLQIQAGNPVFHILLPFTVHHESNMFSLRPRVLRYSWASGQEPDHSSGWPLLVCVSAHWR